METDWKTDALAKAAAMQEQQAAQLNDDDVEQAFADQAWMQVQNKVRPIAKEPYILGFEIVWKNDSNSKMIGIYAFRVNKKLFYSPVFFINGEIKGTDLFYSHDRKMFNPATNEWIEYFLAQEQNTQGSPVDRSVYDENPKQMNIADIESPPARSFGSRRAGVEHGVGPAHDAAAAKSIEEDLKGGKIDEEEAKKRTEKELHGGHPHGKSAFTHKVAQEVFESMQQSHEGAQESILKTFIQNEGVEAFNKLASWIESDFEFADQLMKLVPLDHFMPASLAFHKKASAAVPPSITLHLGSFNESVPELLKVAHVKQGYTFEDTRPKTDMDHLYENPRAFESVSEAGVWSVIMRGGEQEEFIAAPYMNKDWLTGHDNGFFPHWDEPHSIDGQNPFGSIVPNQRHKKVMLLEQSSKKYDTFSKELFGEKTTSEVKEIPDSIIKSKPSKKKAYLMYDRVGKWVTGPFAVKKIYTFDGVTKIDLFDYSDDEVYTIKLNPDHDKNDYQALVFGTETMGWIEVDSSIEKRDYADSNRVRFDSLDVRPGDEKDVTQAIDFHAGYKQATLRRLNEDGFNLRHNGRTSPEITRIGAIGALMKEANVCEEEATHAVSVAAEQGSHTFFCKLAKKLQLENLDAEFYQPSQNDYGVLEDERVQTQTLTADTEDNTTSYDNETIWKHGEDNKDSESDDSSDPKPGKNYDRVKSAAMMEQLLQAGSADDIAQAAGESGQRNIFEHGVVGQLVNTYDAADMIQQYVPDLTQALDKIGRILFLLYWRPEDFTERYGSDDQAELENMLMSTFKQYGDLVLELLKRNPDAETKMISSN